MLIRLIAYLNKQLEQLILKLADTGQPSGLPPVGEDWTIERVEEELARMQAELTLLEAKTMVRER